MIDIDEIEARLKAATPGPWLVAYDADHPMNGGMPFNFVVATIGNDTIAEDLCGDDARFIAHAPEDVAALIAEVRRLSAENARLREEVVRLQDLVNCDCDSETRKALDRANMGRTLDLAETIRLSAENARLREAMPTLKELYALVRVCDQWIPSHVRHDEKTLRGWLARLDAAKGVR